MFWQRQKAVWYAVGVVAAVWLVACTGYLVAKSRKLTAEKVRNYLRAVDLSKLSGAARAKALGDLANKLNALSYEERRAARLDREWSRWFSAMTEQEKGEFVEATLPAGLKQVLAAFEQLPEARRKRAIDDALKRLKDAREQLASQDGQLPPDWQTNPPPVVSDELRRKLTTVGLKAFYSESSAQTKAEVAPVLEELQRIMESGMMLRPR
jgi:DNA repair exonuclease SbcCD ATPase subunit